MVKLLIYTKTLILSPELERAGNFTYKIIFYFFPWPLEGRFKVECKKIPWLLFASLLWWISTQILQRPWKDCPYIKRYPETTTWKQDSQSTKALEFYGMVWHCKWVLDWAIFFRWVLIGSLIYVYCSEPSLILRDTWTCAFKQMDAISNICSL